MITLLKLGLAFMALVSLFAFLVRGGFLVAMACESWADRRFAEGGWVSAMVYSLAVGLTFGMAAIVGTAFLVYVRSIF